MNYTEDQKKRMIQKLEAMPNGTVFDLNKKDVCPIKCKLVRTRSSVSLLATELNDEVLLTVHGNVLGGQVFPKVVDTIEDYINHWDLMTKQYFISLARLQGYEP
jgi:hypothetical protein